MARQIIGKIFNHFSSNFDSVNLKQMTEKYFLNLYTIVFFCYVKASSTENICLIFYVHDIFAVVCSHERFVCN